MTLARTVALALAIALFIGAGWASSTQSLQPQSLIVFLLAAGLATGAHALKRRRSSPQ